MNRKQELRKRSKEKEKSDGENDLSPVSDWMPPGGTHHWRNVV